MRQPDYWRDNAWGHSSRAWLKKIADLPPGKYCAHPRHEPPKHIVLEDGIWEYTCPGCGTVTTFTVQKPWR